MTHFTPLAHRPGSPSTILSTSDVVELECRLTRQKGPIGVGECTARVDGETAVGWTPCKRSPRWSGWLPGPESAGKSPDKSAALPENRGKLAFLGRVKDARFKRQVVPGDVVELECRLTRQKGGPDWAQRPSHTPGPEPGS